MTRQPIVGGDWYVLAAAGLALSCLGCRSPRTVAAAPAPPSLPQPPAKRASDIRLSIAYLNAQRPKHPRDAGLLIALGKAYVAAGRLQEGLAAFQDASTLDPKQVPALLGQGQLWLRLGRPAKAVEAYTRAARLMPDQPLLELELSNAYLDLRDFVSAQEHAERAQKLDPQNPEVYRALGLIYSNTGDLTATTRAGQKAIDLDPADIRNWLQMGLLYVAMRKHVDAARCYRRALQLDPTNVEANVQLADALNQIDQAKTTREEIHRLLGRALTLDPHDARALYLLGRLYLEDGKFDLAAPTLRRAVRYNPLSQDTQLALGQALTRSGKPEEGRRIIVKAQTALNGAVDFRGLEYQAYTNPNPNVHLRLAELYQRNDLYDSALYAVERGLKMSPKDPKLIALHEQLLRRAPALGSSR
jgi:tetratricopeptide (TPR) repeat protein